MAENNGQIVAFKATHTARENIERVKQGFRHYIEMGLALIELREGRQYAELGYKTFDEMCQGEFDMERTRAYQLIDAAKVAHNLSTVVDILPANESQARPLAILPADKQAAAWEEVQRTAPKTGVTRAIVEKVVEKFRKIGGKKSVKAPKVAGWTKDDLKDDEELSAAFGKLEKVWGRPDAEAIRKGAVERMNRKDVLALVNLPRETTDKIHDLVMGNHWTPTEAIAFINDMPDEGSTVEDLMNWCLATKGKYETFDINGFHLQVKYVGKAR